MIARSGMRHRSSVVVVRLLLQYSTIDVMDAGIGSKSAVKKRQQKPFEDWRPLRNLPRGS
jgi:hypothetical protein